MAAFSAEADGLLLRLDRKFAWGVAVDTAGRALFGRQQEGDTFESVLRASLGDTICEHFYFPYARKLWGLEPQDLSGVQARKRVSAGTVAKIFRRILSPGERNRFYYPRKGYGQISEAIAAEGRKHGADYLLGWSASAIGTADGRFRIEITNIRGETRLIEADHVWSTIPVPVLCRLIAPPAPENVLRACRKINYRSMILIYLTLPLNRYSATDAYYFPEEHINMTRLSEPKNYSGTDQPAGMTTLCAELPCRYQGRKWNMPDEELGRLILRDMGAAGLPVENPIRTFCHRLPQAYPIYTMGYEQDLGIVESWLGNMANLLVFGRQGLFAHDNTHHTLYMAYAAVNCMGMDGRFDRERWEDYRRVFATHVVED